MIVFGEDGFKLKGHSPMREISRDPMDRSIDVLTSWLRRKLGKHDAGPIFKTVRNGGYQMTAPVHTQAESR
ncbi:winged helix-turn-helix domain-containing protein [Hoeflea sp. WL0058]|uniref:Winged helix-turn-helix domain-containing protein n=1 Tax=Flavimaribacter sediminis TaxID=2865987 RepID=A0AAE3D0X9_9HYPH|nr:winged helix-turn-helix domain-containing protein [Flavimaribacter sediminis]